MTLQQFASQLDKNYNETFTTNFIEDVLTHTTEKLTILNSAKLPNDFGIYVFFLKTETYFDSFDFLVELWNESEFVKFPKAIKGNFNECKLQNGFLPFYVGKSENLAKRISEHITHPKTHATYGLKLAQRSNFTLSNFHIGYWKLDVEEKVSKEVRQFIITTLEQKVREKLRPLIGKK